MLLVWELNIRTVSALSRLPIYGGSLLFPYLKYYVDNSPLFITDYSPDYSFLASNIIWAGMYDILMMSCLPSYKIPKYAIWVFY